jgi:tetratricopeptide (TPR) repeat protein
MVQNSFRIRPCCLIAFIFIAFACGGRSISAQLGLLSNRGQAPQAKSQAELDLYLKIVTDTTSQSILKDVGDFASQFPKSDLLGVAYQYQMHAFEDLGDFEGMIEAGQKALLANPDNINTLLTLAPAISNHVAGSGDSDKLLRQAEGYARRILVAVDQIKPPRQIPLEQWEATKRGMQSRAHEVLGVIAINRTQPMIAVDEFKAAINFAPSSEGSLYFRLGVACVYAGERVDARKYLLRAIELGPESVRQLAQNEIGMLDKKSTLK